MVKMPPPAGSKAFEKFLLNKKFKGPESVVEYRNGADVTAENLKKDGFKYPIFVRSKEGLGLKVPGTHFQVNNLLLHIDPNMEIDVVDVRSQRDQKMHLRNFVRYFLSEQREQDYEKGILYNLLSLEFSNTRLSKLVAPPAAAKELSLVTQCWNEQQEEEEAPTVLKYCLVGTAHSYTDFHIDFGGSSVWYHCLWGKKIFYLAPPSPDNLKSYEDWLASDCTGFLGDVLPVVSRVEVSSGHTFMIPGGWIHAVYTEKDSLVFGGNFLTMINIPNQIAAYQLEMRQKTEYRFLFPGFEKLHWFAAKHIVKRLKMARRDRSQPSRIELQAAEVLQSVLRTWLRVAKRHLVDIGEVIPRSLVPNDNTENAALLLKTLTDLVDYFPPKIPKFRVINKVSVEEENPRQPIVIKIAKESVRAASESSVTATINAVVAQSAKKRRASAESSVDSDEEVFDMSRGIEQGDFYYPKVTASDDEEAGTSPRNSPKKPRKQSKKSAASSAKKQSKRDCRRLPLLNATVEDKVLTPLPASKEPVAAPAAKKKVTKANDSTRKRLAKKLGMKFNF